MFRPWSQDPRPIWRVHATWATFEPVDAEDHERLLETLAETGHVRAPALEVSGSQLTLTMLVRACRRDAASHAAARIAAVACKAAGLGHLGATMGVRATRLRPTSRQALA